MDELINPEYSYDNLNQDQINFLIARLAITSDPIVAQEDFYKLCKRHVSGMAILKIQRESKAAIKEAREEIFNNQMDEIPITHAYVRMAIANNRAEYLAKHPTSRQVLKVMVDKVDKDGIEYSRAEEVLFEEIDDVQLRAWVKLAQDEEFLNKKLKLELINKKIEDEMIESTGFTPARINTRIRDAEVE